MRPLRHLVVAVTLSLLGTGAQAHAATDLELLGGRFQVSAEWRTAAGVSGQGAAIPFSTESGLFWFFSPGKVELVVKVVDACVPPFDRFWFFASGLTNTEVTITVADNWSGQTRSYHHAGGPLFAPIADTAAFATCGFSAPACGHGSSADIHASPRPDPAAENLALLLGDGVAAERALYERLSADLTAIRSTEPGFSYATFRNIAWDPQYLYVNLTPEAYAAILAGTYHEWDCLNTWYGATLQGVWDSAPFVLMRFAPLLHPYRTGPDYAALPGVTSTEAFTFAYPSGGIPPTWGLCAIADGAAFDYFLEGNAWYYFRVANAGAPPIVMGAWNGLGSAPSWFQRLSECYTRLDALSLGL